MIPSPAASADPESWRRAQRLAAIEAREALSPERYAAINDALVGHVEKLLLQLAPSRLAFCWPFRQEPDLRAMIGRWLAAAAGRVALLPVVLEKDAPLLFRRWLPGMEMSHDRYGIPYPREGENLRPDVVLVPVNVFDAAGFRLGYGGGYFDRTLACMRPVAVGVGFEIGRAASVLPRPHDRPMDWIVTEKGVFRASRSDFHRKSR